MYYEEKNINGKIYFRGDPKGEWELMNYRMLVRHYCELKERSDKYWRELQELKEGKCKDCKWHDLWNGCNRLTQDTQYLEAVAEEIEYPGVYERYQPAINYINTSSDFGCILWEKMDE
jgi:MoaA/NifB/PqqE/SkfB family radical SAM enzyme